MFRFETFRPGDLIGSRDYLLDTAALEDWLSLFPADRHGDLMPPGMMAAVTIRAYSDVLQPRPPGNVHAAQSFTLRRRPRRGSRLTTTIRCAERELRKGRRWIVFATETTDASTGAPAFSGRMTVIWAA